MVETKFLTVFTRSLESGNDGSLLEIKEEELWVGSGYLSNEGETIGRSEWGSFEKNKLNLKLYPNSSL